MHCQGGTFPAKQPDTFLLHANSLGWGKMWEQKATLRDSKERCCITGHPLSVLGSGEELQRLCWVHGKFSGMLQSFDMLDCA